ncbi:hypothetical protein YT1_0625 [Rhodococcus ruber]|nr:hypothetical protein YT1_0625 [Rhodococcus ruber]
MAERNAAREGGAVRNLLQDKNSEIRDGAVTGARREGTDTAHDISYRPHPSARLLRSTD